MSRPCFALSVMLCCLAGPLLVIGNTHAQDAVVSPSHDPGECLVCPLARGPLEPCGGYSDYDYNQYWRDEYMPSAPATETSATPAADGPESLADDSAADSWESSYEDYYADYVYGDEASNTDARDESINETEDLTADDVPADATDALLDEPLDETSDEEAAIDYEAYEEEWFSYGSETAVDAPAVSVPSTDEAYESLTESTNEAFIEESIDDASEVANETWGDEEAWYREEYGYEGALDQQIEAPAVDAEVAGSLETGYDEAYDNAMATETVMTPDDYESIDDAYEAYDDLYDFDSTPVEASETETIEETTAPMIEDRAAHAKAPEPAWLTELVDRMLAIVTPAPAPDVCAQEWDCGAECWADPQPDQASLALSAADTLDGLASLLQNAAERLRGTAGGSVAETAQTASDGTSR